MLGLKENRIGCGKLCFKDKEAAFQSRNSVTCKFVLMNANLTRDDPTSADSQST